MEKEAGAEGSEKSGLSAKDIADMTKSAMASAGGGAAQAPPLWAGMGAASFVKYTAILVHIVFLVCMAILIWIFITRDKGAPGAMPMTHTVAYQREVAEAMALLAYRQYDEAEKRFRIGASLMSDLRSRQEYSGDAAVGGALLLADQSMKLKEAVHDSVYVKGPLALMLKARRNMNAGHKALAEGRYDEASRSFDAAAVNYKAIRALPKYATEKYRIFETAMVDALRLAGHATRMKSEAEPILPAKAPTDYEGAEPGTESPGSAEKEAKAPVPEPVE